MSKMWRSSIHHFNLSIEHETTKQLFTVQSCLTKNRNASCSRLVLSSNSDSVPNLIFATFPSSLLITKINCIILLSQPWRCSTTQNSSAVACLQTKSKFLACNLHQKVDEEMSNINYPKIVTPWVHLLTNCLHELPD